MRLLKEYMRMVLDEYWGEPVNGTRNIMNKADPTMPQGRSQVKAPGEAAAEHTLMLDDDGTIVEPDVRKKIKDYFRKMKLIPTDVPGKTYK